MAGQCYRIYKVGSPASSDFYLCDFGSLFGLTVLPADEEEHTRFRDNPCDDPLYSAVPTVPPHTHRWERANAWYNMHSYWPKAVWLWLMTTQTWMLTIRKVTESLG